MRINPSYIRGTATATGAVFVVAAAAIGLAPAHAGVEFLAEDFTGTRTQPGVWRAPSVEGRIPVCLTAGIRTRKGSIPACREVGSGKAAPDAPGHGAVQLTDNRKNDRGMLLLNRDVDARDGLRIEFDMFHYNANKEKGRGGDGISFYLVDGAQKKVETGESGGRLGYKGIKGALLGIGFDEYGNFSTKSVKEFSTGPGISPNTVVLRGADKTDYRYIRGVRSPAPLAVDEAKNRDDARRTVSVDLTKNYRLSLHIDFHNGRGAQRLFDKINLRGLPGQPELPDRVKMGFGSSTGTATAYHELRNLKIGSRRPNLSVRAIGGEAAVKAGERVETALLVKNAKQAGPTTGRVSVGYDAHQGLTVVKASGEGWECTHSAPEATCIRQGSGADALAPGAEYPKVNVTLKVGPDANGELSGTARTGTADESDPTDNTADFQINAEPGEAPHLSAEAHGDTWFPSGAAGTITVVVSNAPSAGPTRDKVTATYEVMPGVAITSAAGAGWKCDVQGQKVTCTRRGRAEDALKGGQAYPAINIGVRVPDTMPNTRPGPGVSTAGDADQAGDSTPAPTGEALLHTLRPCPRS